MKESKTFETLNALPGIVAIAAALPLSQNVFGLDLAPSRYPAVDRSFVLSSFAVAPPYERGPDAIRLDQQADVTE